VRFARAKHPDRFSKVELTPMIDVVFLLIIFFMTTAQFARLTRADVELPIEKGEQEEIPDEAGLVINITREGEIIISDVTVALDDLDAIVADELRRSTHRDARRLKLLLRADRGASAASLNDVIARLRGMGVGAARLATEVPRASSTP
jgi:biopolymer transport protein ExbD